MISEKYKKVIIQYHLDNPNFGNSTFFYPKIKKIIDKNTTSSLLDYGCGKGAMISKILEDYPNIHVKGYDPCVSKFSDLPNEEFDILISTNTLENVENIHIDDVLKHIESLFTQKGLFVISIFNQSFYDNNPEATEENFYFHTIEKTTDWWKDKISSFMIDCQINASEYDYGHPDKIAALIEVVRA